MTIKEANERVDEIRDNIERYGGPAAHSGEDDLYRDFVRAIVDNQCEDIDKIAGIIIETQDMEFDRWYE